MIKKLLANDIFKKVLYIVITVMMILCVISTFTVKAEMSDFDQTISSISSEEYASLPMTGCHIEKDENGNNKYLADNNDPNVYLTVPSVAVSAVQINFGQALSKNTTIQLYYASNGGGLSEKNSVLITGLKGETSVIIAVPEEVYSSLRLDINGDYSIESIEFSTLPDDVYSTYYEFHIISVVILFVILVILALIEKKFGYYSNIKDVVAREIAYCKEIKRQKNMFAFVLRAASDVLKIIYAFILIIFIAKGVINASNVLTVFTLALLTLAMHIADSIYNGVNILPAKLFLAISIIAISMLSYCLPIATISWDEQIHYHNSTQLRSMLYNNEYSNADNSIWIMAGGFDFVNNMEESCEKRIYLDQIVSNGERKSVNLYNYVGYLPAATTMFVCDLFDINFISMFVLSKIANGLVYSIVVYQGMKRLKSGQYILSSVALMPTCLFLASTFSYDYWVNAFTMYSIAYLISELQQPKKKLTIKDAVFMFGSMFLGCGPKAIYFVLLIPFVFIAKEKFEGRLTQKRFIISALSVAFVILLTFAIPLLTNGAGSDMRGGSNVNGPEQIEFILSNPLEYAEIVIKHIRSYISIENLPDWFNFFAYLGNNTIECSTVTIILMALCALWDKSRCDRFSHCLAFKVTMYLTLFIQLVLISTALYISFTGVGSQGIAGVQGRYAFPLLFPFLYCIGSVHTRTTINPKFMKALIFGLLTVNIFWCMYSIYIQRLIQN